MVILTKKKFNFKLDGEEYTTKGGMELETAPAWISKTWLYELAVADGDIIIAEDTSEKAEDVAVAKATKKPKSKTEPGVTEPGVTEPGVTKPGVTKPEK